MKEIIPLKKEIIFKTIIGKITNIEINHEYNVNDDLVSGNVILNGSYKMTEASVLEEDFYFKIPFGVSIPNRVKKDTIKIEIDDFNYEINKDILSVNVNLEFTCEEDYFKEEVKEVQEVIPPIINEIETHKEVNTNNEINNITNNIVNDNKYYSYKIYIVRNGDTIESICNKYNISMDIIKEYNDINNINIGDKILIPSNND